MNIANHKKTILILIITLLVFFGYWFFFLSKKDNQQNANKSTNQNLKPQAVVSNTPYDKEFVSSLLGLSSVKLDASIFQSKVYQALSYPEIPFVVNYPRESGRDNPFLPIGLDTTSPDKNIQNQNKTENVATSTTLTSTSTISKPIPKKL